MKSARLAMRQKAGYNKSEQMEFFVEHQSREGMQMERFLWLFQDDFGDNMEVVWKEMAGEPNVLSQDSFLDHCREQMKECTVKLVMVSPCKGFTDGTIGQLKKESVAGDNGRHREPSVFHLETGQRRWCQICSVR